MPTDPRKQSRANVIDFIAVATLIAIAAAALDVIAVYLDLGQSRRGIQYIPWTLWSFSIIGWTVIALAAAAPFLLLRRARPYSVLAALVAAPGAVLLIRLLPLKRTYWTFPTGKVTTLLVWLAVVLPIAFVAGRLIAPRRPLPRWLRNAALLIVIVAAAAPLVAAIPRLRGERSRPKTPARNVVLIFLDTMRYDTSGIAPGGGTAAPQLAAFASGGVVFEHAIAPAPWTVPSHLSVMGGVPAERLAVDFEHQRLATTTMLGRLFHDRGYRTGAVFANYMLDTDTGIADGIDDFQIPARGLDLDRTGYGQLLRELWPRHRRDRPWSEWLAPEVTGRAIHFVDKGDAPYFLAVNYVDPHDPYPNACSCSGCPTFDVAQDMKAFADAWSDAKPLAPEEREKLVGLYTRSVRCMDASLGRLFAKLEPQMARGETIVAVVGDHGEQFGEHRLITHGNSVYSQAIHVPLALRGGGLSPARISGPVSITFLHDALLRLASADSGAAIREVVLIAQRYPATSRYDPPRGAPRQVAAPLFALHEGSYSMIVGAQRMELYDLEHDPAETRDVAGDSRLANLRDAMLSKARRLAAARGAIRPGDAAFSGLGYFH